MSYLVDADWAIDALANKRNAHVVLNELSSHRLLICTSTIAELLEGTLTKPDSEARQARLYDLIGPWTRVVLTEELAVVIASVRHDLRRRGLGISDFDVVVAATALHYDLTILTRNFRHFTRIDGLRIYSPTI